MADYNSLYTGAQIDAGVGKANTAVQPAQIANFETTTQLNTRDTNNRDRANHTGTQTSTTISDFSSAVTAVVNGLGLSAAFDSAAAILLIDSAYVQARQSLVGVGGLDSALTIQLIDSAYVQSRQDFAYASLTGKPLILDSDLIVQLIDSDYVALRSPASGLDSALAIQLIDSNYVRARQDFAYSSLTGTPTTLDSALTIQLIDSAYVQARQDFAYSSLTGAPTVLDSDLITQLIDSAYIALRAPAAEAGLDSALTEQFIDSAYVQARQDFAYSSLTGAPTALSAFINDTLFLDSATATQLIDSAYIQLRQSSVGTGGLDSALVTQLIDSAYVQLRQTPQDFSYASLTGAPNVLDSADVATIAGSISGLDSTGVRSLVDSAYVQARQDFAYSSLTGAPTALSAFTNDTLYLDSVTATQLIDSAYIQARQLSAASGVDSAYVTSQINALIDGAPGALDTLNELAAAINDDSQAYNTLLSLVNAKIDSAVALTLITTTVDSAYVQLRQSTVGTGGLDSALVTQLVDSAYVQLRQDFAYSSLTGTPNVLDSADVALIAGGLSGLDSTGVINLVDSAYVQLRQDFAYSSLTGAPSLLDSALVTQLIDSAYVALRAPAASGGVDSAAANTLIDAKIQVLDIADIVGSTGNPGEYLKSLGNGNASWGNVTTVIDSAYVAARAPAASGFLDSAAAITLVDSAYVLARSPAGPATWQKISANYTLSAGDRIAVNTDSAWTMTLPASPTFSDEVYIIDATGNAAVKNITVSGNSQKILASDSDLVINVNRASVAMMFYGDSQGWILTSAF